VEGFLWGRGRDGEKQEEHPSRVRKGGGEQSQVHESPRAREIGSSSTTHEDAYVASLPMFPYNQLSPQTLPKSPHGG
jgi:hypothetical protein